MHKYYIIISYPKMSPTLLTNFDSNSKIPPLISEKPIKVLQQKEQTLPPNSKTEYIQK